MSKRQKKTEKLDEKDDFGAFEKHTKGIGMKLLLKMGFKPGQGLGKDAEGRAEPVQIKLRARGVGIGFSEDGGEDEKMEMEMEEVEFLESVNVGTGVGVNFSSKKEMAARHVRISHDRGPEFNVMTLETTSKNTLEIIDMTNPKPTAAGPLAALLSDLKSKKRADQSTLHQKQFELDSTLRQLERNIEEAEKERKKVDEIKKWNEIKRTVGEFVGFDYSSNDFESLCSQIGILFQDKSSAVVELVEKAVLSVLIPILQSFRPADRQFAVDRFEKLRRVLPQNLYDQLIYHWWWPSIRHPHFTAPIESIQDWEGAMEVLKDWAPVLPDEFLVLFIGNQVLLPRVHSLLLSDSVDDQTIGSVWGFMVELKFTQVISVLNNELITWLTDRIIKVQPTPKSFTKLLKEFTVNWKGIDLESAWLKRCERLLQRDLIIDPSDQDLIPIECVLLVQKSGLVSSKRISHSLTINLIPKLRKCVQKWLKSSSVDFEEVADWYVAWKEAFPEELLSENEGEFMDGFGEILSAINETIS